VLKHHSGPLRDLVFGEQKPAAQFRPNGVGLVRVHVTLIV